eukprot:TRINITY_DN6696_c0_g1_i1.p1 TRINITY_DN6696_c0_g1~~TRINITY_DN6696_c0_g1_i1.p1  ORF type:complete len:839 (-),score=150.20 TRINITY_DN6696_c0_g1_i1:51-2567(-)
MKSAGTSLKKQRRGQYEITELPGHMSISKSGNFLASPKPRHRHYNDEEEATLREKIFLTLEEPRYSPMAFAVHVGILVLIIGAAVDLGIMSGPKYFDGPPDSLMYINLTIVIIFTVEYILRLCTAERWWHWVIMPYNIIDLLAIIPAYIEVGLHATSKDHNVQILGVVRIVRLMRVFRILKILRYSEIIKAWLVPRVNNILGKKKIYFYYAFHQLSHQINAVVLIFVFIVLFQFIVVGEFMHNFGIIMAGHVAVIAGLFIFVEGLNFGLTPIADKLGEKIMKKIPLWGALIVSFILGVLVTIAEPSVSALSTLGSVVSRKEAPYLVYMLRDLNILLLFVIGFGVGLSTFLGVWKFLRNWRLKTMLPISLLPILGMSCIMAFWTKDISMVLGLSWDCGALTTGEVTCPIVLALGTRISKAIKNAGDKPFQGQKKVTFKEKMTMSHEDLQIRKRRRWLKKIRQRKKVHAEGTGIVTLASLFPVLTVQLMAFILLYKDKAELQGLSESEDKSWSEKTPYEELIWAVRAVFPLSFFLIFVVIVVLRVQLPKLNFKEIIVLSEQVEHEVHPNRQHHTPFRVDSAGSDITPTASEEGLVENDIAVEMPAAEEPVVKRSRWIFFMGLLLVLVGVIIFNYGLYYGLTEMGNEIGTVLPAVFVKVDSVSNSPRFNYSFGIFLVVLFAWVVGYVATQAEPALHVIGKEVEKMGEMSRKALVNAVSVGVATGIAVGVFKIIYNLPLIWFLLGGYILSLLLNYASSEYMVNIAWDSAGVTTGPITVPFVLALGVALGKAVDNNDGFGLLTLASLGPIPTVLIFGIITKIHRYVTQIKEEDSTELPSINSS